MPRRALLILLLLLCGGLRPTLALTEGEFGSVRHKKRIFSLYTSIHNRNLDPGWTIRERFGAGFDLSFLIGRRHPHPVNKLLYFTLDNTFADFLDRRFTYSLTPGFLVRTWIPFFKIGYGAGVNIRTGWKEDTVWGVAGTALIDFHGFYAASRIIFPTDKRPVENELRIGFLFAGKYQ